jgi:hypothetical protein
MARAKHPSNKRPGNKHLSNKRPNKGPKTFAPPPPPEAFGSSSVPSSDDQTKAGGFSLHDLFAQQARAMLDRTDLDEEQKQNVLVAMSCPCCGAGGMSFTAKLKRRK